MARLSRPRSDRPFEVKAHLTYEAVVTLVADSPEQAIERFQRGDWTDYERLELVDWMMDGEVKGVERG